MTDRPHSTALQRIEEIATGSQSAERLISIFKAVLSTVPFAGGIASLMSDIIPSGRQRRLEAFTAQVADDLLRLQNRISHDYIGTDDFAFMFEQCFRGAATNPQKEKLNAFRGILVNAAICQDVPEQEKEYFLNLANALSVLHMRILRFMATPEQYMQDMNLTTDSLRGGFSDMLQIAIPGMDPTLIESAFGDLYQRALISTDKSIFGTMTSSQGFHLLGQRVTPVGKRFIAFCIVPA
jgi:hypothetical protein